MSYTITISGHTESARGEANVLDMAADFAEQIGAEGSFAFAGQHLQVSSAPAADGVAEARKAVGAYNETADADDQAGKAAHAAAAPAVDEIEPE